MLASHYDVARFGFETCTERLVGGDAAGEGRGHDTGVPTTNAVVRDRNGAIKLVKAVYSDFDPGFEVYPTIDKLFPNGIALSPDNRILYATDNSGWVAIDLDGVVPTAPPAARSGSRTRSPAAG